MSLLKRFFFLPLFIILACLFFFPYKQVVAFYFEDSDRLIAFFPIAESQTFQIVYTHSIHFTDVVETYTIFEKELVLTELMYENFAVGMPSNAEGNEVFERKNGKYVITNMNRRFRTIDLRIGQVRANHRLIYKEKEVVLGEKIGYGKWVRIVPTRISLWQQLKGVNIIDE
ncbi:DUF1850 domain-containing protein [Anoxybacillus sp. EFIL]|uniref:DUF1850 domain-containing protein n=1 Tax=Anoxybacillus sp. EFIL TaxID=2508869 RepID=UPI00148CEBCF|nr:DUF1850 domain-containing protein [Anoxybacillus sp. EFIL]NNU95423.1 DUF1850 domain-containing protein [Anoxybacillus sp. EFIL]